MNINHFCKNVLKRVGFGWSGFWMSQKKSTIAHWTPLVENVALGFKTDKNYWFGLCAIYWCLILYKIIIWLLKQIMVILGKRKWVLSATSNIFVKTTENLIFRNPFLWFSFLGKKFTIWYSSNLFFAPCFVHFLQSWLADGRVVAM